MLKLYFKVILFDWMTQLFADTLVSFTSLLKDKKRKHGIPSHCLSNYSVYKY
jgi:hypothetical protein